MTQHVIFTRGLPGSGKSTWAREFLYYNDNYIRVNLDSIRSMFGAEFSKDNERLAVQLQDDAILASLRSGKSVIVDNTHLHKGNNGAGPQHIMTLIWESGFDVTYEVRDFHTPFEECSERNINRAANPKPTDSEAVPEEAMRRMLKTQQREIDRGLWTPAQIQKNLPFVEPYVPDPELP